MCLPSNPTPAPQDNSMQESIQQDARDDAQGVRSDRKDDVLEKGVRRARGGGGRRSLLTGNKGGMGYYNENL
mgnify:CR=1 FL=1